MATKPLKSIKFPGLSDTYTVPQVDATLTTSGAAADAKIVGDDISDLNERLDDVESLGDEVAEIAVKVYGKNLINPDTLTVGRLGTDGTVSDLSSYRTSDYILLKPGSYVLGRESFSDGTALAPDYFGYGLYDTDKTWIANSRVYNQYTEVTVLSLTITEDTYIRVTGNKNYFEKMVLDSGAYILQSGTAFDGWEPYKAPKMYALCSEVNVDKIIPLFPGKNLYDKNSCGPKNGFYYNSGSGSVTSSSNYAITGLIPVKPNTKYIFSAGSANVSMVYFFKGPGGYIHISGSTINGAAFTTPSECTYIGISLFGSSHTEEEYNAAIAAAQLEEGETATTYEPYTENRVLSVPASASDIGKALIPKKVADGRVVEWEFGESGSSVVIDTTLTQSGEAADSKVVGDKITAIQGDINGVAPIYLSKNLYNSAACNPQNGKSYNMQNGTVEDDANYAISGKIPIDASTQYVFSAGGIRIRRAYFFGGTDGSTYISRTDVSNPTGPVTTPSNATYVGFEMFASSHTADQYNAAIAVAQLEKGSVATSYVPYAETRKVPTNRLADGDSFEGVINYTVNKSLVNLFDKTQAEDNKVYGTYGITSSTSYAFSGLIPVEPNRQYNYSIDETLEAGYISSYYQEWDSNKGIIGETQQNQSNVSIDQIQTGSTTAYISFNIYFGRAHTTQEFTNAIDTIMVVEGTQRPLEYIPYKYEPVVDHTKIDNMYENNADRFVGKKWLVCGTSVSYQDSKKYTEGVAEGEIVRGYVGDIARRKPMLVKNVAVSGSTLAGSDTNSLITIYQSLNMGDYDFITIEYGINDFGNNVPVGTASDAAGTSTFAACLKTIIEYALGENPIVGLIICTDPDVRGTTQNNNGNTLKDYADVMLDIAKQYRLPVCDWFYHSGINALTKGDGSSRYYLTQAGTHPSVYGHMRMGAMLNQVFDSLLC